ncbi:MAG: Cache 3/Cache 2 fusion domain-containing protein [Rhodocyclaceae bacterium]
MLNSYRRLPIAQQIILTAVALLLLVFSLMTLIVDRMAGQTAVADAGHSLEQQTKIMVGTLDTFFDNVKARGERQSKFFFQTIGSTITSGQGTMMTGDVDLPVLKVGSETGNANHKLLQDFKTLTGDEAAILILKDGKVYRAATLLKRDGKSMDGSVLPPGDPVSEALLKGLDYSGMTVRNGSYNFSTVKLVRDAEGKPFAAYSVRINLEPELKQIRELFGKVVTGKTGYVYVMRPTDEKTIGEFVLHPKFQGKLMGDMDASDETKNRLRQMLVNKNGQSRYFMLDADKREREKLTQYATSAAWNWTLVSGSWLDEYLEESIKLRNTLIVVSLASAALLCVFLFIAVNRRLRGLVALLGDVSKLGDGDLRVDLGVSASDASSRNEVHVLRNAVSAMAGNMRTLLSDISNTAKRVSAAADHLQGVAEVTMAGSEKQSQSASGIAASVEEMSVSISHVADSARDASQTTTEAKRSAEQGRTVVGQTMVELERVAGDIRQSAELIDSLGERSNQISTIVNVIKEIADQTNLLALNAAIEAARAGESGRGFAVVADEVRKLAERTALSTQEISGTIQAIVGETGSAVERMQSVSRQMAGSVDLARGASESLAAIDAQAGRTVQTVQGIAESMREQSSASQEISRLIEGIASMSDENAATAGRNRDEAAGLQRMSTELQGMLARFRV